MSDTSEELNAQEFGDEDPDDAVDDSDKDGEE